MSPWISPARWRSCAAKRRSHGVRILGWWSFESRRSIDVKVGSGRSCIATRTRWLPRAQPRREKRQAPVPKVTDESDPMPAERGEDRVSKRRRDVSGEIAAVWPECQAISEAGRMGSEQRDL